MKIDVAILLTFILSFSYSFANPEGHSAVSDDVAVEVDGSNLNITASNHAIIEWQDFSIDTGETTQFFQPSSNSAVLNKVTSNIPSSIYGNLIGNGNVYLMNANGIVVGATGVVDTGGFIATTLDQGAANFFENGQLELLGDSDAAIINMGNITATGDIFLVAAKIDNQGLIKSTSGFVGLAAGKDVLLKESGEERIFIRPVGEGEVLSSGSIEALNIEIKSRGNPYSTAINLEGQLTATKVNEVGGRVFLAADNGDINLGVVSAMTLDGEITANADGDITINADGDIQLIELSSTGDISIESGGAITDANSSGEDAINITASDLSLVAATGIGLIDAEIAISVDVSTLTAVNSTIGDIVIDNNGYDGVTFIDLPNVEIEYNQFDIGVDETVQFIQPNSVSFVLNQITVDPNPSEILSTLTSDGNIYLVNPSGIMIGNTGPISSSISVSSVGGGSSVVSLIQPIAFQPARTQLPNEQLNSALFTNFKKGKSSSTSLRSQFVSDGDNSGLIAKFSSQASDDSQSIMNLDR